jgi:hypothetical protein
MKNTARTSDIPIWHNIQKLSDARANLRYYSESIDVTLGVELIFLDITPIFRE